MKRISMIEGKIINANTTLKMMYLVTPSRFNGNKMLIIYLIAFTI